jgi:CheY-like chemotaxis protein
LEVSRRRTLVLLEALLMSSQPRFQAMPRYDFGGMTILVVEDHPDSLELFAAILAQLGATVLAASTAGEAFQLFTLHRPHLVVSDIGLPDEDGHSLMRRLRRLPEGGAVPAIAVTAFATFRDRREALAAGYDSYLPKPVDIARLCETIDELVHGPRSTIR